MAARIVILKIIFGLLKCAFSQPFCATPFDIPDMLQLIPQQNLRTPANAYVVRIFVHIMKKSDGTGGVSLQDVSTALDILVNDFEPHDICLSLLGIDEIRSDTYYNQTNFLADCDGDGILDRPDCNNDGKFDVFSPNSHPNAIDIYLYPPNKLNFGMASNIPGLAVVIGGTAYNQFLVTSHVISHELGHCLGLYHTFHGLCEAGCPELVDGSNCSVCGDYVCDTPADPQMFEVDPYTCVWNGTTCGVPSVDANGNPYNPDERNIMAYVPPSCMQYFTPGQGSRMRLVIGNSPILQNVIVPNDLILSNLTISSGQARMYDALHTITVSNLTVERGGTLTLRAGYQIKMLPSVRAKSTSFFHAFIDNQCSTVDSFNYAKVVNVSNTTSYKDVPLTNYPYLVSRGSFRFNVYPNPFSNEAYIKYTLESLGAVTVAIYNQVGQRVAVPVDNILQKQGSYVVRYAPVSLSRGTYLLVMEVRYIVTGKVERFQKVIVKRE